jgi:hypothetical protein
MNISPKAVAAALIPILASLAIYLLTGDETVLLGILLGLAGGTGAVIAPPAAGVRQETVAKIADGSLSVVPYPPPSNPQSGTRPAQ